MSKLRKLANWLKVPAIVLAVLYAVGAFIAWDFLWIRAIADMEPSDRLVLGVFGGAICLWVYPLISGKCR